MGDAKLAIDQGGGIFAGDDGIGHFRSPRFSLRAILTELSFAKMSHGRSDRIHHGGKRHIRDSQRSVPQFLSHIVTDHRRWRACR
ncbi:hypothetical protein KCP77_01980 [Salmonella enterica subsp. enterica]|nr:hypothetical protein KCP77_01980 [Salmonella enterica subsp. enterica]